MTGCIYMTDSPSNQDNGTPAGEEASREASVLYGRAGTVTFFTLLSRVLGMTRDLVIAHRFGASGMTDSWVQAFRIPNALRRLTAEGSMTIAFVPSFVKVRSEQGGEAARLFAQRVLGMVLAVTLLLTGLGMLFSETLAWVFSPGFIDDPERLGMTRSLLFWTFPYLVQISLVAWAMGVLNSEGRFAAPAAAPIFLNIGIIAAVLGFSGMFSPPIMAIAGGVLAGGVVQVFLQMPSLAMVGALRGPRMGWRDPAMRHFLGLLLPSLAGVAVYELNIIALGMIASYLPTGQIFHYNNATRLAELVMGLFAFAFTTAGLPTLSGHFTNRRWEAMANTIRLTFSATLYVILPATVGLALAGEGIVSMLYLHGAFTYTDVRSTAAALALLALGAPAVAMVRVMLPVYYAMGDARTPVPVALVTVAVTAALGWWLSQRFQVRGLAAGLSLGTGFQCALLALLLRPKLRRMGPVFPWGATARQAGTSLMMGLWVYFFHGFGKWELGPASLFNWLILACIVLGGAGLYFLLTLSLKEPQAVNWLALARRVGGKATKTAKPPGNNR